MKRYSTTCLWVCVILIALLANLSIVQAQEPMPTTPDIPLVRLTGDTEFQAAQPARKMIYDVPLVRITGDIHFDKQQLEWHIVGDVPLVVYTGDVRPGMTIVVSEQHESKPFTYIGSPNLKNMQLVTEFTASHDVGLFAEDAELIDMSQPLRVTGREAISDFLANYYSGTHLFREAYEEPRRVIAQDESMIIYESVLYGTALRRDGSLVGALRQPMTVEVPMVSILEIENGEIASMHMYYDADQMLIPHNLR